MSEIYHSAHPAGAFSLIVYSGCMTHMTFDKSPFVFYTPIEIASFEMGTKATVAVAGRRSVVLNGIYNSKIVEWKLQNVLHVPSFDYSLLFVPEMDKGGPKTTFEGDVCSIAKGGEELV